jgi:hypothetical protein
MVNSHKELSFEIQNRHKDMAVDVSMEKIPFFMCFPSNSVIKPLQSQEFVVSFRPKDLGKILQLLKVCLISSEYSLEIKLDGFANTIIEKSP